MNKFIEDSKLYWLLPDIHNLFFHIFKSLIFEIVNPLYTNSKINSWLEPLNTYPLFVPIQISPKLSEKKVVILCLSESLGPTI